MLFNSFEFIFIFLPIVLVVFFKIGSVGHHRIAISWLVGASLFFYAWWNPAYLALMLGSIIFNYSMGVALSNENKQHKLRFLLMTGIACNLALIGYFKYANFFIENVNVFTGTTYHLETIILPLAISFFTFQQIAYLVDAYNKETREYNFLHYSLFVTFFPQLIAGPIVHHKELLPQFIKDSLYKVDHRNFSEGLTIFFLGLFKKVCLADGLAVYATPTFSAVEHGAVISFFEGWAAALAYTFQLYFDFSGYSDMAIGIARMFNVQLPLNFNSPYKSLNITEFWRRWHMTLSRFLRDYLYIPLGGNRKGEARHFANVMIVMLLGGLWHGAGWTFVAWGLLHGIYLTINHAWHLLRVAILPNVNGTNALGRGFSRIFTFLAIVIGWVIFRAESLGGGTIILKGMMGMNGFILPAQIANIIPGIGDLVEQIGTMPLLGGGTIMGVFEMIGMFTLSCILLCLPATHEMSPRLKALALLGSFYFTIQAVLFSHTPSEFLYFQF